MRTGLKYCSVFILFVFHTLKAQLVFVPLASHYPISATKPHLQRVEVIGDTLNLPFFDDFTSNSSIPNTNYWENYGGTTVNSDYSLLPPNENCVVFDGRDRKGNIYNSSNIYAIGKTDSLISKPINLSGLSISDNVVLSFYLQNGGKGDRSDGQQGDSISLSFLNKDQKWEHIWARKDDKVTMSITLNPISNSVDTSYIYAKDTVFSPYFIALSEDRFFHNGFRLKFNSVGRMSGDYDIWLLDYIYLDANRNTTDTSFEDRSFSFLHANILKEYSTIPSSQFFGYEERLLNESIQFGYSNLKRSVEDPIDISVRLLNTSGSEELWKKDVFLVTQNNPSINSVSVEGLPNQLGLVKKDSVVLKLQAYFSNSPDAGIFKKNDTISRSIHIHQSLGYDDGTAEVSVTMNRRDAQLAYQFVLNEPDTLTHVQFYFPNVQGKMTSTTFDLRVWNNISKRNASGNVIPGTFNDLVLSKNRSVVYGDSTLNRFIEYEIDSILIVKDTFYIGYLQKSQYDFYLGFDMNSPIKSNTRIFTNIGRGWQPYADAKGNLMIRPVFKNVKSILGRTDNSSEKSSFNSVQVIYPNNDFSCFVIKGVELPEYVYIYDMLGNLISKNIGLPEGKLYCPNHLRPGVYIVVVEKDGKKVSARMVHQN